MDLQSLRVISSNRGSFCPQICSLSQKAAERQVFASFGRWGSCKVDERSVFEIGVSKLKVCSTLRGMVVIRAMGKKNSSGNSDQPVPEEDGPKGSNPSNRNKLNLTDWRNFRANLIIGKKQIQVVDTPSEAGASPEISKPLGAKWAHSICVPETGCVLVATEKLDGVDTFERTVVLLLRSGNKDPREGPFGVIINRPPQKKMKHMKLPQDLSTTFGECSLYHGGPLEASMFLLNTGENTQITRFEQVIPGLCFGARNSLDAAADLVKKGVLRPQDFRFFFGYAGWQLDQLKEEIESDYWYVAACSANLINGASANPSSGLWEEILQLMGGHYSELSRKPKQDSQ